ncbi:CDC73-domain-containing protein [Glonium stellatum]|uniref:CDC73-domain-containing protein n=1 Tax=Glonium stellatum TaxID=574774 RepID=A0A8E2FAK4_9PEZI|nr:CDC73-domain-containing protein [Glonium stellatum]
MASSAELEDPLLNLRRAIATNTTPLLTTTAEPTSANDAQQDIALATHIQFNHDDMHRSFPLTTPTRFVSAGIPLDLRSIYFAWLNKDATVPEYISTTQRLNEELPGGAGGSVQNLVFVQKLDLIAWLQGHSDESEYIKPLDSESATAQATSAADVASGATGGVATLPSTSTAVGGKAGRQVDPRLIEIYEGERKMGDRNSVLRGVKPTDFSHVRKTAATFLTSRHPNRPGAAPPTSSTLPAPSAALVSNLKKPSRRLEPIILLSPSASSLLRMSNIKSFLDSGVYIPANSAEASTTSVNLLHISRTLPSIDASRPLRFILVDTPDQFKPDYWSRVVAVFTTGQTWQFKGYKWTQPTELFSHVLGVYVGWQGEEPPPVVKGWGRGVISVKVDKWNSVQGSAGRWRDREVVEQVWGSIEESMRARGWGKDGPGGAR